MAQALIDAGCKRLVYVSGGRDYGVQMFIDRSKGFMDAIDEAKAAGKDVELVADVAGWPELGTYEAGAERRDPEGLRRSGLLVRRGYLVSGALQRGHVGHA